MENKPKDPMTKFRSVIRGKNSKGGDRFQLYLSQEEAAALITTIQANLDNPKGVKLDLHISKKVHEGRTFDSAIGFVKGVSESGAYGGAGGGAGGAKKFTPKATGPTPDMVARVAALKNKTVG
jgi:hypothetical protein